MVVSFEFSMISPNGHDKYSLFSRFGKQNVREVFAEMGNNLFHFKSKNLKPCSGFKNIAYKETSFPQKYVKGWTTVVQL